MQKTIVAPAGVPDGEHEANLRQVQDQALASLYSATAIVGFGLILSVIQFPAIWQAGYTGIFLMFAPFLLRAVLGRTYLARAWLLVGLWSAAIVAGMTWLPVYPVLCLLVLPVMLVVLLIDARPGFLMAVVATLVSVAAVRGGAPLNLTLWALTASVMWGAFLLCWLALKPMTDALQWSWQHYEEAHQQADQARNNQAELKLALADLADAGANMVRLNEMLVVARRVAEDAERTKAEFVANVSHELRTPLNMIIGFSEMMLQSPKTYGRIPPPLRADLDVILRNSQHLSALIDDVLDLSQIEAGQMALTKERAGLHEIVMAAVEAMRPLYESKGLYLRVNVPNGIDLFCDRTRLREVLLNLLSNAGRFTDHGGVEVHAVVEGQEVTVGVTDTGPGIAAEEQDKLFRPFHQIDNSLRRRKGGSGLGLSISKQFVELHGGRMWLESTPGQGTSFFFSLPIETPEPGSAKAQSWINPEWEFHQRTRPWLAPHPQLRSRLIVVEKGRVLQRLLKRYLRNADIIEAESLAAAALEMKREPANALLINDSAFVSTIEQMSTSVILPEATPALICSLPAEQDAAHTLGADGYLIKPIAREALLASLERLHIMSGTVLIVDDETEAVRLFWRMLTSSGRGYRVLTANNGQQALSILRQERPDVVLLDLTMPGMDGFQVLNLRPREEWRDVPFIVVSARDPAGHPVVTNALCIMRSGGLSLAQILRYIEVISGRLGEEQTDQPDQTDQPERPAQPEAQPG